MKIKSACWALVILMPLLQNCSSKKSDNQEDVLKAVKYALVEQSGGVMERTYSGVTQSSSQTNLSFRTGGLILKLDAKVGQRIKKGKLLAQLDQKDVRLAYDQALADVQSAKVQYDGASSNFERTKQLYETDNASLSDYEQAKTSFTNAESSYEISLKRLDLQKSQIEYTEIIAPMSGIISEVKVEINEVIRSGSTIIVMSSEKSNDIEAQVGLPEKYINEIKNGDAVTVSLSSNLTLKGSVTEIGYSSSLTGVTYPVTISLESGSNKELRPDMPVEVSFQFGSADQEPMLIAPLKAVASGVDGNYVYKLEVNEVAYLAKKTIVELGDITKAGYEIKSGLGEGDIVAVAGLSVLYDGRKVKLLDKIAR